MLAISSTSATDPVSMKNLIAPFPSRAAVATDRAFVELSAGRGPTASSTTSSTLRHIVSRPEPEPSITGTPAASARSIR